MRAKGAFIARFDSDDICKPNRFENQLQFFSDNPKVDILGTSINIIDNKSVIKSQRKFQTEDKHIKFILNFLCPICHHRLCSGVKLFPEICNFMMKISHNLKI